MSGQAGTISQLLEDGVIAVLRGADEEHLAPIGEALVAGGITVLEVTAEGSGAAGRLERLGELYGADPDVLLGAGTVLDEPTAVRMIDAGAQFIVTPSFSEAVMRAGHRHGVPVIPGIMTPTEAQRALEAGTDVVKVFPASTVGHGHLRALTGPFPQLRLIPTGGIDLENARSFLDAGAVGLGIGSALVSDDVLATEDWQALEERARQFAALVEDA